MRAKAEIDDLLEGAIGPQGVPGVAATVAVGDEVVYEAAFGERVLGSGKAMTPDTVFWIASMTKAITSAAAMQLVERGVLDLDAPASDVVTELRDVAVLEGFDDDGRPRRRPPKRAPTLRHLLTHTSGHGYEIWKADVARYQEVTGTPGILSCANAALTTPLLFDPGERWEYGIGIDWAGKMIERVSGTRLSEALEKNLLAPLAMNSTSFRLSASQRERLARVHARGPDGSLAAMDLEIPQEPEFEMGGGGLYSTVADYLRFTRMILGGGALDGARVLRAETVESMSRNQTGDVDFRPLRTVAPTLSNDADFFPGMPQKWGLSFLINTSPSPQGRSAGSLAWAGLANAYYWIDPVRGVTGVLASQILPFFDDLAIGLFRAFERAVYDGL